MSGGCLRSLQFTSLNATTYADIDQQPMSQATSPASVMQQLDAGMGVTIGAFARRFFLGIWGCGADRGQCGFWACQVAA